MGASTRTENVRTRRRQKVLAAMLVANATITAGVTSSAIRCPVPWNERIYQI